MRPLTSNDKLKKANITMRLLSAMDPAQRVSLYKTPTLFAYPDTTEAIEREQCFVPIAESQNATLGYSQENYMSLSN